MFIKNEKDFSQVELNLDYDRDNADCTLMKYFTPEDNQEKDSRDKLITCDHMNEKYNTSRKLLSEQKIEKFFNKQIKLRNALKQCYWDRQTFIYPSSSRGESPKIV